MLAAAMSGCFPSDGSTPSPSADEPPTAIAPSMTVATPTAAAGAAVPFAVPEFDGPPISPVTGGTTHVYRNPGDEPRADFLRLSYTIPAGWEVGDVYIGKNLGEADEVALSFWTAPGIYADPCRRSESELVPFDLSQHTHEGDTVVLLNHPAQGLSAQRGRSASEPRTVMMGHLPGDPSTPAVRVELSVPDDLDIASCDDGAYVAWPAAGPGAPGNGNHVAGQTDIVYQVDVDLAPLLIDASYRPDSSPRDIRELQSVLGSIIFQRY
jgi:hypothetical protein